MKIYSISVVKNESDVIAVSLAKALEWSDMIFCLDNGSTDGTWEIILEISKNNPKVVPWKQLDVPFYEGLRAEVFNEFRAVAKKGDWWCSRLDADEFYIDNPKDFLSRVSPKYHFVTKDSIEYYLTHEDVGELDFTKGFEENIDHIRYYDKYTYREPRFFRHRERLVWYPSDNYPKYMGIVNPILIRAKHYQYRSPQQIQMRLDVRNEARENGFEGWHHASQKHYVEKLRHRSELLYDEQDGNYHPLGSLNDYRHPFLKLVIKRIFHTLRNAVKIVIYYFNIP